jgi:hypothetical protein
MEQSRWAARQDIHIGFAFAENSFLLSAIISFVSREKQAKHVDLIDLFTYTPFFIRKSGKFFPLYSISKIPN